MSMGPDVKRVVDVASGQVSRRIGVEWEIGAQRQLESPLSQARQILHSPTLFTCLPGVVGMQETGAGLTGQQIVTCPVLGERRQHCHCGLQEVLETRARLAVKGWIDGELLSIRGDWQLVRQGQGTVLSFHGRYTVPEAVCEEMVHALRRYSPLPIRSDADAILSRAVERLLEEALAGYSREYLAALCARLGSGPSAT
jgi:carbon monoxide dehydrogenase subunit G